MKTSFVSLVAVLLCTAMAPAVVSPAWAQNAPATMTDADTLRDAVAEMESEATLETKTAADTAPVPGTGDDTPKPYNDNKPKYYDDYGNPYNTYDYFEAQPGIVQVALQRDPHLPAGHFVLSMIAGNSFVSCLKVQNPKVTTEFVGGSMNIKLDKFAVDMRDMPQYAHYECNNAPQQPIANVNLSREQFLDNNVKKIKFRTDKATVTYNVKMTDEYVQLISESRNPPDRQRFVPLFVDGVSNTLKFWFYPENTVILSMVGASKDVALESRLMEMARSKGLTPLNEIFPDHKNYRTKPDLYYFVDKEGRYKNVNNELFDYVQADAMKFGLEADEPVKKDVAVFIRKPGQYD